MRRAGRSPTAFDALVVSVDYRLAPEHRFPAWARTTAYGRARLGPGSPRRLSSAARKRADCRWLATVREGTSPRWSCSKARDKHGPRSLASPSSCSCIPSTDYEFVELLRMIDNAEGYFLDARARYGGSSWATTLESPRSRASDPRVSPAVARRTSRGSRPAPALHRAVRPAPGPRRGVRRSSRSSG